jgi:hypothetical protein
MAVQMRIYKSIIGHVGHHGRMYIQFLDSARLSENDEHLSLSALLSLLQA